MRAPGFWWQSGISIPAIALSPFSLLYRIVAELRMSMTVPKKADIPVLCIGNPTVGGAGKTPTTITLVKMLRNQGFRPVILTRGYGGRLKGPVLVDLKHHESRDTGDEPLLLSRHAPVVVSADRAVGAKLASHHGDIIVMDDGFQNPSLFKDFSLLLIDGPAGIGNGFCLPAGPMRMGLAPQIAAADAMLIIGQDDHGLTERVRKRGALVLHGTIGGNPPAALRGERLVAYSGIGRPAKFFDTLDEAGLNTVARIPFPDHHEFRDGEADALIEHAARENALLVSTEKDCARLNAAAGGALARLYAKTIPYPVAMTFDHDSRKVLTGLIQDKIGKAGQPSPAQD